MRRFFALLAILLFGAVCTTPTLRAQPAPLAPFERLIGGEWQSGSARPEITEENGYIPE